MSDRRAFAWHRLRSALAVTVLSVGAACHRSPHVGATDGPTTTKSVTDSLPVSAVATSAELIPPVPRARIPRNSARFEIDAVDDSSARFKPREASWVKPGMDVYIVDPFRRDALVARARVTSIWNETAIAVVTSQVTRVTNQQIVLMMPPTAPWYRTRRFWGGTVLGLVIGGASGAAIAK